MWAEEGKGGCVWRSREGCQTGKREQSIQEPGWYGRSVNGTSNAGVSMGPVMQAYEILLLTEHRPEQLAILAPAQDSSF